MSNEENLIKNDQLSPEERRARASRAGKASGAARRRRKAMKKALSDLMTLPPDSAEAKAALAGLGDLLEDADNQTAVLAGLMKKAMKGDPKAVKELRSILGENQTAEEKAERKARIEHTKASTELIRARAHADEHEDTGDDGFIDALTGKAVEDW